MIRIGLLVDSTESPCTKSPQQRRNDRFFKNGTEQGGLNVGDCRNKYSVAKYKYKYQWHEY